MHLDVAPFIVGRIILIGALVWFPAFIKYSFHIWQAISRIRSV